MLVLDDLLVRPFVSFLDVLHSMAVEELYDVEAIRNDIKENELMYDIGERTHEEYEARKTELESELELAEEARERLGGSQIEVKR